MHYQHYRDMFFHYCTALTIIVYVHNIHYTYVHMYITSGPAQNACITHEYKQPVGYITEFT